MALVVLLALGAAGGAVALTAPEVARGTTVLGIDIGGRSRVEAVDALRRGLGTRLTAPFGVRIGESTGTIDPSAVGLSLDADATVARAADDGPDPFRALLGTREIGPVVAIDPVRLDAALQKLEGAKTQGLVRPAIRYEGLEPQPVYPTAGTGLDPARSASSVGEQWLRTDVVTVPIVPVEPGTDRAELDTLVADLAAPAVADPVTVTTPEGEFEIPPAAVAASLLMESDPGGTILPRVDPAALRTALAEELTEVEEPGEDAEIVVTGGAPTVEPHVDGSAVDIAKLAADLLPVLSRADDRTVAAVLVPTPPKLTTEAATALGVTEKVSSFTTRFTGGQDRNINITLVADDVDGALVLPGENFSLNDFTGERTRSDGYVEAPVIRDGKIKNEVGGGISQFATTLFNAYYYAGLEDVFHRPHGYWISRYPPVVEATVYYPSLDLEFRNDSEHGILIDTSYTDSSITVTLWGTKRYDVKTEYGPKTDETQPETVYLVDEEDCNPTSGIPGFAQTAYRVFYQGGNEVKRERLFWRYNAEPRFICGPDPAAATGAPPVEED